MKQEMMGWQWHQLDHVQIICTLLAPDRFFYWLDALSDAQPTVLKH